MLTIYVIFPLHIGVASIAIPGEILGYFEARKRFGNPNLSMEKIMKETINLCKRGITVSRSLAKNLKKTEQDVRNDVGLRYVLRHLVRFRFTNLDI